MQIRLTVVDPLSPPDRAGGRAASCDVLVTAPVGTALAAVATALASAVAGEGGVSRAGETERGGGPVVLYADGERLDTQRSTLGEPPLVDGAVLSLGAPAAPEPHPELDEAPTQLHVVAGPDAGGVHLLHGGQIHIGRSADADVPLDDPDVSRLHCAVTVGGDGRVSVADLDSTNGTTLDGTRVGTRPVRFPPGALLRIGESVLRLSPSGGRRLGTEPDGEGHVRVAPGDVSSLAGTGREGADLSSAGREVADRASGGREGVGGEGAAPGRATGSAGDRPGQGRTAPGGTARAGGLRYAPGGVEAGLGAQGSAGASGGAAYAPGGERSGRGTGRGGDNAYTPGTSRGRRVSGRAGDAAGAGGGATGLGAAGAGSGSGSTSSSGAAPGYRSASGSTADSGSRAGSGSRAASDSGPTSGSGAAPGYGSTSGSRAGSGSRSASDSGPTSGSGAAPGYGSASNSGPTSGYGSTSGTGSAPGTGAVEGSPHAREARDSGGSSAQPPTDRTHHTYGSADWGASGGGPAGAQGHGRAEPPVVVPGQGGAPRIENRRADADPRGTAGTRSDAGDPNDGHPADGHGTGTGGDTHAGRLGVGSFDIPRTADADRDADPGPGPGPGPEQTGRRKGTPLRGTDVPQGVRRRGGLSAWARRLTGGRGEQQTARPEAYDEKRPPAAAVPSATATQVPEVWPDPAALLLTALGPGARLWERGPGHPEALTVRLGTADRAAPDGSGLLPAVPVTADLREAGALGLAGPRARLAGLARAVVAQLAALHAPETLEIVLISADRSRPAKERGAEWSWLGWLPHVRPGHGQDCRLLLAHDREQAAARTDELLRRLDDHLTDTAVTPGRSPIPAARSATSPDRPKSARRPSWAREDAEDESSGGFSGPYTVVVVDGDPGGADLRKAVARLAAEGPRAGIHVVCLAETAPASPASPVTDTYEAACAVAPTFRECGAVGLLSGDVATALRLMRVARAGVPAGTGARDGGSADTGGTPGPYDDGPDTRTPHIPRPSAGSGSGSGSDKTRTVPRPAAPGPARPATGASAANEPRTEVAAAHADTPHAVTEPAHSGPTPVGPTPVGHGTVAAVDAVSAAWAERFARALAPLRTDGAAGGRHARVSSPLPQTARLLDELGLARATPPSLMTRWADAADDPESLGGRAWAVLGAGPRGPVCADLVAEGPHLLIEGPAGSGRTELLRAVVASLAAAERPDRLSVVLVDGRDSVGSGGTPAGGSGHGEGLRVCTDVPHVTTHLTANDPVRMREFAQSLSAELKRRGELLGRSDFAEWHTGRELSGRMVSQRTAAPRGALGDPADGDLDSPPSATIRLRPAAARRQTETAPPLPRLVVIVDDLDALVSPPLGSPGRPAAGSVIRALEAVAREGERLGVHLVAATGPGGRTAESEPARRATLRVTLDAPVPGPDEPAPGRGRLTWSDGRVTGFQAGRVTGRIPRTATLRPTVVPLEWERMGDPPTRRPVRELGNGPTDLALLASALERAAREVAAVEVPSLL